METKEAFISPPTLAWARERLRTGDESLAHSLNVKVTRLRAWEGGESRPTFRQAQSLADALRIPLAFLFLQKPPTLVLPLPDRRTAALRDHPSPSADLLDTANAVKRKQDWYRDYRVAQSAEALAFVATCRIEDDPSLVAIAMRKALELPSDHYRASKSWTDHLTRLVRAAETIGVLVFRSGIVGSNTRRILDVSEFRGMAFSDKLAPAIFINTRDAVSAQVFTFAHELAHLWIGESATTDADVAADEDASRSDTEKFCDKVASEFLVPNGNFIGDWRSFSNLEEAIRRLPQLYRVSSVMILRRAYELGLIARTLFFDRVLVEKSRQRATRIESKGGSFYNNFASRNGRLLIGSVFESVAEGRTLYREAAAILELKVGTLAQLMTRSAPAKDA
jgi:Zn-dependent peptidase ImmA (M78 family)